MPDPVFTFTCSQPPLINIITDTPVCKNSLYGMLYIVLATACKNAGILPPTYIHMSCDCNTSAYRDSHHKHVVTGDLTFIKDNRLRTLLSKGLNYRDQAPPSVNAAYNAAKTAVNEYCKKMSDRFKKPIVMFTEWKTLILDKVKHQLNNCKPFPYNTILSNDNVLKELKDLHDKYVLVPTDKAANNVTIVCKKFYISLIKQEIESNNFEPVNCSMDNIIKQHEKFMLKHGIKLLPKKSQTSVFIYYTQTT